MLRLGYKRRGRLTQVSDKMILGILDRWGPDEWLFLTKYTIRLRAVEVYIAGRGGIGKEWG